MTDTNVIKLAQPGTFADSLTEILRNEEVWPKTRAQRCWVHKTANVLNRLPNSLQAAKRALQGIWMAQTRTDAEAALDAFIENLRHQVRQGR